MGPGPLAVHCQRSAKRGAGGQMRTPGNSDVPTFWKRGNGALAVLVCKRGDAVLVMESAPTTPHPTALGMRPHPHATVGMYMYILWCLCLWFVSLCFCRFCFNRVVGL